MDETRQFFDTVFANMPDEEHYILIWLGEDKFSGWFKNVEEAAAFIDRHRSRDVYFGAALSPKDHGPALRLKVDGMERPPAYLCALWSDVDLLGDGHTKKNLPTTEEEALSVLFPGVQPTTIVHSGGGLQMWWVFVEPWALDSEEEMRRAANLAARWIRALKARGAAHGWDIDSVGDLPRIMRVPGTTNCKIPGNPRPVRIVEIHPERRYHWSDLEEFLDDIGAPKVTLSATAVATGQLQYSAAAEPPAEKFSALCENEPKFKQSWEHKRKDLTDQSPSAYDMALANVAVQAGWADQEIADLLIAHRRRYKADLKLRDTYYGATLAKAHSAVVSLERLVMDIEEMPVARPIERDEAGEIKPDLHKAELDPLQRKAVLTDRLSEIFGLVDRHQIICFIKYLSTPASYAIRTRSSYIRVKDLHTMVTPRLLRETIGELTDFMIPRFKEDAKWDAIQQMILEACVPTPAGEEATDAGLLESHLDGYLLSAKVADTFNPADNGRQPFRRNGRVYVYMEELRKWVRLNLGDRHTQREICLMLREAGATQEKIPCGKTCRQPWRLREGYVVPEKPKSEQEQQQEPEWVVGDQESEVKPSIQ